MNAPLPDLVLCAEEPIRVPGAIQPHGWMVVLDGEGSLVGYSANWRDAQQAQQALALVREALGGLDDGEAPAPLGVVEVDGRALDVLAHRRGGLTVVEFEPRSPQTGTQAPIYSLARHFLPQLQRADTVGKLAQLAADEIKRLTGFGRTLVYRFDEEGHGEVLAEAIEPGYDSYLGHRFPAADIPPQARDLYRLNQIRLIPDAHYTAVPLLGAAPGWDSRTLDMSFATLRSVSPVHLEYMRNMRTLASMSVSIVLGDRLWGLISCHDHQPRHLSFQTRAACEHLGRLLSLQIASQEDNADVAARLELRHLTLQLVAHLADSDATLQRLVGEPALLLRMAGASGAAVVLNDQCWTTGETPEPAQVAALAQWINAKGAETWSTDRLPEVYPPGLDFVARAAGVLAISISQVHQHLVLWFRPELVRTIRWAGDPRKEVQVTAGRIHPRQSFESWQEQVRGRSEAWSPAEVSAAGELRHALIGIVLRRAEEMNEVATELGRVNKELEAFSYTVSHDLRAPMRHIAGYVDLVQDMEGKQLSERAMRYLSHVKEAAAYAGHLVDALLDFSRMGRAALKRSQVDTRALVDELVAEYSRQEAGRVIAWEVDPGLPVLTADPFLLQVALRNLLSNAVKYTRTRKSPQVRIRAIRNADGEGLEVADNGVGFQQKYVGKLFGVFQRLHQAEEFEGTGIGLASVRRIVERHGGTVWAHGEPDQGAVFGFSLPGGKGDAQAPRLSRKRT
ncbi:MAG TPA: ATP-binding protein [Ramlibacter sp.]|jgi:light-regulated signal transduction histidine kinase (bacteriophytochrome)|uniref:ATP-binding protein n=1 Tax=Ramlibacter sp. TaxID=1917967 RepID=UPI002D58B612|nr:ATP-binding protein [Ramlibacter sp.]HZY16889.1 ATP-binding protein [Ramlibacter sp.]